MSKGNILIVEDDPSIRETMKFVLETEGYSVAAATNGEEGIAMLRAMQPPCLVLLDLTMPVMDGLEFLRIKNKDVAIAPTPVIVVSAVAEQASGAGATDIIKKPIDLATLLAVIRKYCERLKT